MTPFTKEHGVFVGGSAVAMLFPIISAPIVARLYSPEDFGVYAVFIALATILFSMSSLELRQVPMLEEKLKSGAHGVQLAISIIAFFCLFIFLLLCVIPSEWLNLVIGVSATPFLFWLPLTIFFMGVSDVLYIWAVKRKEYKFLTRNKLILAFTTMTLQILIGLYDPGPIGFILANLAGLFLATVLLLRLYHKHIKNLQVILSFNSAISQIKNHYRLAVWSMPATLINSSSEFLPDLLINRFFGPAQLGQYSLAMRMLNLPLSFLSRSIQDFFHQQVTDEFAVSGNCQKTFWRFFALTSIGAIILVIPLIIFIPIVFPIIFGSQWDQAGTLIQALTFLIIVRFISSPLSYIWIVCNQQRLNFIWQIGLLIATASALYIPPNFMPESSLYDTLWIYSLAVGSWYVVCIFISFYFSRANFKTAG